MIQGMSEICINCVHQEVCRYECHAPSEHCNDYAVADDFRPHGNWIFSRCDKCGAYHNGMYRNFCPNCGADMKGGAE